MISSSTAPGTISASSKDLSQFLQSPANMQVFRHLPPQTGRWFLGLLGKAYFSSNSRKKQAVMAAQHRCLGVKAEDRQAAERLWAATLDGMIDHYYEKLFLACQSFSRIKQTMQHRMGARGLDVLDNALEKGRGVLFVTGHFGAVEFIPCALALWGYPVTVLVHCKTAKLQQRMDDLAERIGCRLLDPKSGPVFFNVLKELKEGRIVMTQCDEMDNWRPYPDREIRFLNLDLKLDKSLDLLARKSGAEVVFGLNHRLPGRRYQLAVERPDAHPVSAGLDLLSAQCLNLLGHYIYKDPAAWYEWSKIAKVLPMPGKEVSDEADESLGLPAQVAVQAGGAA